jgi:hypothetical protein
MAAGLAAIGAVLNLAVAWTCAVTVDLGQQSVAELYTDVGLDHHWEVYRWKGLSGTRVLSRCWKGFAPGPYNHGDPADLVTSWGRIETPAEPLAPSLSEIDDGWGVPLRSMGSYVTVQWNDDGEKSFSRTGIFTLRSSAGAGGRGVYLPLLPLWLGFLGNTIVYALVVIAIRGAVRDLLRAIRYTRPRHALHAHP